MPSPSPQELALVMCLRNHASALPPGASKTAALLRSHAIALESANDAGRRLAEFEQYAAHYKGLRDEPAVGVSEADWDAVVRDVRIRAKAAIRSKGLDRSLLGRLSALFGTS